MARLVEQWVQASAWRPAVLKLVELLASMARLVSSGSKLRLGDPLFNKDPVGSLVESLDLMTKLVEQ
jgi:hypothetical protein